MQKQSSQCIVLMRQRIHDQLASIINYPINIITAPMGFGKTTAVRSFLAQERYTHIWVTMTESIKISPNEYFWYLLLHELSKLDPKFAGILHELGFPEDSVQVVRIIDKIRETNFSKHFILVIDDFYLIENAQINSLLERLAYASIPWFHIVIITRHSPALPLAEFSVKGLCFALSSQDLCFTPAEIYDYLDLIGFEASSHICQQICSYSNGWITAIYVMVSSYLQNGYLDLNRSVYTMLEATFYSRYSDVVKTTLLRLSIFENFTIAQAEYVLQDPHIAATLHRLCQVNAFINRDSSGIYKFHQIFLDFLTEERQKSSMDIAPIIHRAGLWYSQHNDHLQALKFWLIAKDYEHIFQELEYSNISSINSINRNLLFQIFNYTDQSLRYKYPLAMLKYIFFYVLHIDKQIGIRLLDEAIEYFKTHTLPRYTPERMMAEAYIVYTSAAFNDYRQIIEYSQKALELLDGQTSLIRTQHSVLTYGLPHFTYAYYRRPGEFAEMVRTLQNGFDAHVKATGGCGAGFEYVAAAEFALETGNLQDVEINARKAIYKAKLFGQTCIILCAQLSLGRLYLYQNRMEEYEELIERLRSMAKTEKNTLNLNIIDNCLGYLCACDGNVQWIPDWLKTGDMSSCSTHYQGSAFNYIIYGKAIYLSGNYIELEILTESFQEYFSYFQNQLGFIHNHIHNALAKYHLYGMTLGVAQLDKALAIGEKDHILMPFVENGKYILPMLSSRLSRVSPAYLAEIVALIKNQPGAAPARKDAGQLSIREAEVLRLMSQSASRKAIADQLFISENTVKRHIQNIYQKLDVNNKTAAIQKFMELQSHGER